MKEQLRQNLTLIIKLAVTGLIGWLIWQKIDLVVVKQLFRSLSWGAVGGAVICLWASIIFASCRWKSLLKAYGEEIPQMLLSRIALIGFFFNQGLPSSIGGDVYRVYAIKNHLKSLSLAMMSIFLERLYGLISLIFVALAALGLQYTRFMDESLWLICLGSLGILIAIVAGLWILPRLPLRFLWQRVPLLKDIIGLLHETSFTVRQHGRILFWTLLSHIMVIYCFIMIAHGLAIPFGWKEGLIVVPLTLIVGTLPISFAGWGVREGMMVYSLAYFDIGAEAALSLSILYGIVQLIVSSLGLGLWLQERHHSSAILQVSNENQY